MCDFEPLKFICSCDKNTSHSPIMHFNQVRDTVKNSIYIYSISIIHRFEINLIMCVYISDGAVLWLWTVLCESRSLTIRSKVLASGYRSTSVRALVDEPYMMWLCARGTCIHSKHSRLGRQLPAIFVTVTSYEGNGVSNHQQQFFQALV